MQKCLYGVAKNNADLSVGVVNGCFVAYRVFTRPADNDVCCCDERH